MARVSRSTKNLAQRIDLNYFKRVYAIPRWRRNLSYGMLAVALSWLGWEALAGKREAYNPGPLAHSHALLTQKCELCHAAKSAFGQKVTDQACLACHTGATHQQQQTFTPSCTGCHTEHSGSIQLTSMRDQACTQCHASLKVKNGAPHFAATITSFDKGHPEFAALRLKDPGTIKFGHAIHLKSNLRRPPGTPPLKCADCHVAAGAYMAPIRYETHCASCHPLSFDARLPESVPHKKPEIVIEFVTKRFAEYIAKHPNEVHVVDPADPRILRPPVPPARDAQEWIARRVADAEVLLWRKTCIECHTLNLPADLAATTRLPEVPEARIPSRWMSHASFDHYPHQMLLCAECHPSAAISDQASDVMLPGIQTCRQCHHSGTDAADSRCSECHLYHDPAKSKTIDGRMRSSDLHL
jgi:hypothetical protein